MMDLMLLLQAFMNALGIGAFDADGSTDWFTLTMPAAPKTQWVEFDVSVSNLVDNIFDSQTIIDKLGDLTCDTCGDCSLCLGDPMCQGFCMTPPSHSCNFYSDNAEASVSTFP